MMRGFFATVRVLRVCHTGGAAGGAVAGLPINKDGRVKNFRRHALKYCWRKFFPGPSVAPFLAFRRLALKKSTIGVL
ncbi:hypothetical protein ACLB1G_04005 [Oxalobacteraceae bacterium A2-2]